MSHAAMGSLAAGLHLRDASSLVRTPCSTSYLVPPSSRPIRRRGLAPPQAAAKEVRRPPAAVPCRPATMSTPLSTCLVMCTCLLMCTAHTQAMVCFYLPLQCKQSYAGQQAAESPCCCAAGHAAEAQPEVQPKGPEAHQAAGPQHRRPACEAGCRMTGGCRCWQPTQPAAARPGAACTTLAARVLAACAFAADYSPTCSIATASHCLTTRFLESSAATACWPAQLARRQPPHPPTHPYTPPHTHTHLPIPPPLAGRRILRCLCAARTARRGAKRRTTLCRPRCWGRGRGMRRSRAGASCRR